MSMINNRHLQAHNGALWAWRAGAVSSDSSTIRSRRPEMFHVAVNDRSAPVLMAMFKLSARIKGALCSHPSTRCRIINHSAAWRAAPTAAVAILKLTPIAIHMTVSELKTAAIYPASKESADFIAIVNTRNHYSKLIAMQTAAVYKLGACLFATGDEHQLSIKLSITAQLVDQNKERIGTAFITK